MVYPFTSKLLVIDMQKKRQKLTSGGAQKFAKIKDTNYLYQRLINRHIAYYAKENIQTTCTPATYIRGGCRNRQGRAELNWRSGLQIKSDKIRCEKMWNSENVKK